MMDILSLLPPTQQIDFALALRRLRGTYLQGALLETLGGLDIAILDKQLADYASPVDLSTLARFGLRRELLFAVPVVLEANPFLLGYYRLLFGYSQKAFYGREEGFRLGRFKAMEGRGAIAALIQPEIPALCHALCGAGSILLSGLSPFHLNLDLLHDLTLLTVGPQLRGGTNNKRGKEGIVQVFEIIREIVAHGAESITDSAITVKSATGRPFVIQFAPDPDIIIREEMDTDYYRNVVAVEVKAGTDESNIHNRLGEAEKSHQKARQQGFTECWTVFNVARLDLAKARHESPSTDRFYSLTRLSARSGDEYDDFRRRILSLTAIAAHTGP